MPKSFYQSRPALAPRSVRGVAAAGTLAIVTLLSACTGEADPAPAPTSTAAEERPSAETCGYVASLLHELTWRQEPIELSANIGTFVSIDDELANLEGSIATGGAIPVTAANIDILGARGAAIVLDKAVERVMAEVHDTEPSTLRWVDEQNKRLIPLNDQATEATQLVQDTYC